MTAPNQNRTDGPGVAPRVVSERLGHASAAFTLDTYGDVLPGQQADAAAAMAALVGR